MGKKKNNEVQKVAPADSPQPAMTEAFQAHMLQMFGDGGVYKPTESQVDKILELQEKGMDYTHTERTQFSPRQKIETTVFIAIVVAFVLIIACVALFANQYLSQVITGAIAFLSGGAGGYGYAKARTKNDE